LNYASEQGVLNEQHNAASAAFWAEQERQRPFILLRPPIFPDGDQWCVLLGENLAEGIAGFGDTPDAASRAFDEAWRKASPPKIARAA
jgi:hypothetical protein